MCGISGIFQRDGRPVDRAVLAAMSATLAHRGPDGAGLWIDGPIGLAHRRLAIRDLSASGAQPMHDPTGRIAVTYNGEIYNDSELRRALERDGGVAFRSDCDAEIIPHGWLLWGEKLLDRMEGMFAFALWDARDGRLVLARDGVGIKPLYVHADDRVVRFGSELKALLADPAQPRALSPSALHSFLAEGSTGPAGTLLSGVRQVAPGTIESFTSHTAATRGFWRPTRSADITDLAEAEQGFEELWPGIVAEHLISDVPVGVLQSGGLDSALVAASLPAGRDVPLFTAEFTDRQHDETELAGAIARSLGRRQRKIAVETETDPEATFRALVHHGDGQLADSSAYAYYVLARGVRREVSVALGGDGGDELFAGYPTYQASRLAERAASLAPAASCERAALCFDRFDAAATDRLSGSAKIARLLRGLAAPEGHAHAEWRRILPRHLARPLYGPALAPLLETDPLGDYRRALDNDGQGTIDRCLLADQRHYLPADLLTKVDRMSMAHGLEIRVPLLDRRVIAFAGRLHTRLLTRLYGQPKRFLRQVARRHGLPPAVWRGKKRGFNLPVARLLRTGLRPLGERLLDREAERLSPYLQPGAVQELWRAHLAGTANHGYVLWTLLTFSVWHGR